MRFRVTFGQRYRRDPHPAQARHEVRIHPDGWIDIHAVDEKDAVRVANEAFDREWAGIYGDEWAEQFVEKHFALGCLFTIPSPRLATR